MELKTNIEAKYKDNQPHIKVNIDFESRLDAYQCGMELSKIKTYQQLEKKLNQAVEKEVKATIHKVQKEYQSDIFGFGEDMQRQDYHRFKKVKDRWNEEFARAEIEVGVTARIRRSGLITKSFLNEMK